MSGAKQPLLGSSSKWLHANILERSGRALRKVERDGTIRTVAGTGKKGNADGDALKAEFNEPNH